MRGQEPGTSKAYRARTGEKSESDAEEETISVREIRGYKDGR